jgi:hypothetical protein
VLEDARDAELAQDLPGSSVIVDRLAEALLVQAMRMWIELPYPDGNPRWLRGLADLQMRKRNCPENAPNTE